MRKLQIVLLFCFTILIFIFCSSMPAHATEDNLTIPRSYFGMHIHRLTRGTNWPSVPFYSIRLLASGVEWFYLEPKSAKFDFNLLDTYVNLSQQKNIEILLPLVFTPQWASARPNEPSAYNKPGLAAEPKNISDWINYVRAVGMRYKGKINCYEIWNEPNVKLFFSGSVDQMVLLTKTAHDTLKEIDPKIKIVSPSPDGKGQAWLDEFLSKGGGNYVDIIGFHFYVMPGPPEDMVSSIQRVKYIMKKHGINKPLWNTEAGWDRQKTLTDKEAAAYVARSYILNWAEGVKRFYWYAWDDLNWIGLRMTRDDNKTITPAGAAYAQIQNWLIGRTIDSCTRGDNGVWTCTISSKSTKLGTIMWSETSSQILRSTNATYPVLEQLDGVSKTLKINEPITISSLPIFLHINGLSTQLQTIKKNNNVRTIEGTPLIIKDKPIIIRNTPLIIK